MSNESMLESLVKSGAKLTPMMEQYYSIKKNYPDTLLLFRMGDFYEVFFDDAIQTSKLLNITLTHRGKIGETKVPMAGIPHHAANNYIDRITGQGYKAAICEQLENPSDSKGIVKRGVTQIVGPAMPYDIEKAESKEHYFLACAFFINNRFYLVNIDFVNGHFSGLSFSSEESLVDQLSLTAPKEFISYMGQWDDFEKVSKFLKKDAIHLTYLSEEYFNHKYTSIYIENLIPAYAQDNIIAKNKDILMPIGALAYYICSTQNLNNFSHIRPFRLENVKGHLQATLNTLVGLEILPKSKETYKDSLLGFFDKTKTSMGARYLKNFFLNPILDHKTICERQKLIGSLLKDPDLVLEIRDLLDKIYDLERILTKIGTNKASASDLLNLASSIRLYTTIKEKTDSLPTKIIEAFFTDELKTLTDLAHIIENALNDEIGASLEKGNLIKQGYNKKRDQLAKLSFNQADKIIELENKYRTQTGITKLRIKSNNIAGYFIEVSKSFSSKVPDYFQRRQTLVNSERYVTDELGVFEKDVISAREKLERLERELFQSILQDVSQNSLLIQKCAKIISDIDLFQSLAWIAWQENFTKPKLMPKEKIIKIVGGWHPLIKSAIKDQFVPHDLHLDDKIFFGLITGPNMAGKTTVMREVAIIQFLAQLGSYVPAQEATLGICDFLFSRLGASDDILKGQSTFMVEMTEAAEILRHATKRSLIILDEVGRGTSTYDGLSIAWALTEHFLTKTMAITLFATHYHELIDVVSSFSSAKNLTVETLSTKGEVQFLYRLIEKSATQSYGIYVAKLAGLPKPVLKRAKSILDSLERNDDSKEKNPYQRDIQPNLFESNNTKNDGVITTEVIPRNLKRIQCSLAKINIVNTTPLEALNKLQELKNLL